MASIYDLKPAFQRLVRPVAGTLVKSGVTANQITLAAVVLSCAAGGAIANHFCLAVSFRHLRDAARTFGITAAR